MAQILQDQARQACLKNTEQRNLDLTRQSSTEIDATDDITETTL